MDRSEWLAERRKGLGSSDAAAVCNLSPYKGPLEVYADKIGVLTERHTQPMRWGLLMEDVIAAAYTEATGCETAKPALALMQHPRNPWMLASLDRVDDRGRIIELKTSRSDQGWGREGTDEIPEGYLIQVQHQMAVAGVEVADVAVLIAGSDFRVYTVPASMELQRRLIEIEEAFWERVIHRTPPEPEWGDPRTPELIAAIYRPVEGESIDLDGEAIEALDRYERLGEWVRDHERDRAIIKARLIERMGGAETGLLVDGRQIVRKRVDRKGYSVPAVCYVDFRVKKARTT